MKSLRRSLRFRLAATGFIAIYVPVLILLAVSVSTTVDIDTDGAETIAADGSVQVTEDVDIVIDERSEPFPWTGITALALAPVAAIIAWSWAGRAVRPIDEIRRVADEIQAEDLSRRLSLDGAGTEVKALASSFDAMLDRLQESAKLQQSLIDETSHEVRTPLAILNTNADVVLAQPNATVDDYRGALERSKSTAQRLAKIVEAMLADARGRARTLTRQRVDLANLVAAVIEEARPVAAEAGVELILTSPGTVTGSVDETSLARAFSNLIENAISHSPENSTISIALSTTGADALIDVTDQGPGIAPEDHERIFERSWRGDPDLPGSPRAGSGLGLAIARQVAHGHHGSLTVTSPAQDGAGASFHLRIPLGPA